MRIWILTENWPPRIGGIERYLTGMARALEQRGHEVIVFSPDRYRFFWPIVRPNWLPFFLLLLIQTFGKKPDVIICGKSLFEGRVARLLQAIRRIPYVICTYAMEISTWQAEEALRSKLVSVLTHANHVTVINRKTRDDIEALGVISQRISFVYPGIDITTLEHMSNSNELMQRLGIRSPFIIAVARLIPRKGIDDLIQAFALVKNRENVSLVIVGDGPERERLEALSQELTVPVFFTGHLSDEDIHALYSRAMLFALTPKELPGDYEGFGIVYLEAAFFGLPTIGTKTGGVPEAIQDQVTGILAEPHDVQSISTAIQTILSDPARATAYGQAGNKRVLDSFQWSSSIDTLEEILSSL